MRKPLVAALLECVEQPLKLDARRFLTGLSSDELEFIAEFLGSCILESQHAFAPNRAELAERVAQFQQARAETVCPCDRDCKMILLREYLCRLGVPALAL
ncbi:MAG: hypothetical protein ABI759_06665 [Candidatus Solibacter sp.]